MSLSRSCSVTERNFDDDIPDNIPGLVQRYLNELNNIRAADDPGHEGVQVAARVIAWECPRQTFRPGATEKEDDVVALRREMGISSPKMCLEYLVDHLKILRRTRVANENMRFELDALVGCTWPSRAVATKRIGVFFSGRYPSRGTAVHQGLTDCDPELLPCQA